MGLNLSFSYGQTPLSPEEQDDLKIYSISTKEELDALEQENIEEASQWILNKKFSYTGPRIGDSGGLESQNFQFYTKLSNSFFIVTKIRKKEI